MRFLLVDRIIEVEHGQRAVGIKNVTMSEDFFADHFPEQPIMPGALLAESLVQLADWIIREGTDFQQSAQPVAFEKLKFLRLAQPGDQLRLEVEIVSQEGCEAAAKGRVRCEGELIATAAFTLQVQPIETLVAAEESARQYRVLLGEGRRQHAPGERAVVTNAETPRRVVITGLGAVTSLGNSVDTIWQAMLDGRSGVREIRQFDSSSFPVQIGSEVEIEKLKLKDVDGLEPLMSRPAQFGIWSLEQAWQDAGLDDNALDPWRCGVLIGALNFPVFEHSVVIQRLAVMRPENYDAQRHLDLCREMPELLAQRNTGTIATLLSARHPLKGVSMAIQTACASATQAVGEAYQMIRRGEADLMVSGGTDSMLSAFCVIGFTLLGVTSFYEGDPTRACRPFDRKRDGLVLGEGAGIVILEDLEHAQRRGARIYAEVIGYGSSCEGYRFTDAHPEGLGAIRCMRAALADAGISPESVDYINAHGTATPQNDRVETMAIKKVFGDYAHRVPISSSKSQLGHLICAAGGIELIVTAKAMQNSVAPPTINLDNPDPDCDLDYIPHDPRPMPIDVALSNSFGFGGQNGTLAIAGYRGD